MDANALAWAPYLIGGAMLLGFPMGRRALKLIFAAAFVIIALMAFSEPDLRD